MIEKTTGALLGKLVELRTELADLAYKLECRGRIDAADVAMMTSARVGELCEELVGGFETTSPSSGESAATCDEQPLTLGAAVR